MRYMCKTEAKWGMPGKIFFGFDWQRLTVPPDTREGYAERAPLVYTPIH
jgi:hypothetical protein